MYDKFLYLQIIFEKIMHKQEKLHSWDKRNHEKQHIHKKPEPQGAIKTTVKLRHL